MPAERYYPELAQAFVRGRLANQQAGIADGERAGLALHNFKCDKALERVQRVLGILRGIAPENLLDVGSGRGAFLWPLLAAFPELPVISIDRNAQRAAEIDAVRIGGVKRLAVCRMDAQHMGFAGRSFDVVTMLEVLEHMPDPRAALRNAVSAARRFVILSVPSTPDRNPEHLHLFSIQDLQHMALDAGAARVSLEHVLNHRIAVVRR
ncbi:MAG: class I SAM-dependent methyltransferase [Bryobacterales bacterium]|nr:class I SAM-dependent methyltransferase [Bryobacterales bacterium]